MIWVQLVYTGCWRVLTQCLFATCIIWIISMCVFCPNSLQDILFCNNYFFSLLLWLSNSMEGGAHGFSFLSVRSAGLEHQDVFFTSWVSPSWPPQARCPPPLLSSGTKHAATGTQWPGAAVAQVCAGLWELCIPQRRCHSTWGEWRSHPCKYFIRKGQRSFIHIMASAEL